MTNSTPLYLICNVGTFCELGFREPVYPYHLVLAQMWRDSIEYRRALIDLRAKAAASKVSLDIIMDNGAHEGLNILPSEYMKICLEAKPHCVVLPDLIGSPGYSTEGTHGDVSRDLSMTFATEYARKDPETRLMFVPQGRSQDDVVDMFRFAQKELDNRKFTIGLGQSYLHWEEGSVTQEAARCLQIERITQLPNAHRARYHVLGARWNYRNLQHRFFEQFAVWGLDTIKPCTCAMHGALYPIDPGVPVDRMSALAVGPSLLDANMRQVCECYGLSKDGLEVYPRCLQCEAKALNRSTHFECKFCGNTGTMGFAE